MKQITLVVCIIALAGIVAGMWYFVAGDITIEGNGAFTSINYTSYPTDPNGSWFHNDSYVFYLTPNRIGSIGCDSTDGSVTGRGVNPVSETYSALRGGANFGSMCQHGDNKDIAVVVQSFASDDFGGIFTLTLDGATGDVPAVGAIADSMRWLTETDQPNIIAIAGTDYLVCVYGSGSNGVARTIEVTTAGVCVDSAVSTVNFDAQLVSYPKIVRIGTQTNFYAIASVGADGEGTISTISVNTGTGALALVDGANFYPTGASGVVGRLEFAQKYQTDYYMVFFGTSSPAYGILSSIDIDSTDGNIVNASLIDTLRVDGASAAQNKTIQGINSGEFLITYMNSVFDSRLGAGAYLDADGMIYTGSTLDVAGYKFHRGSGGAINGVSGYISLTITGVIFRQYFAWDISSEGTTAELSALSMEAGGGVQGGLEGPYKPSVNSVSEYSKLNGVPVGLTPLIRIDDGEIQFTLSTQGDWFHAGDFAFINSSDDSFSSMACDSTDGALTTSTGGDQYKQHNPWPWTDPVGMEVVSMVQHGNNPEMVVVAAGDDANIWGGFYTFAINKTTGVVPAVGSVIDTMRWLGRTDQLDLVAVPGTDYLICIYGTGTTGEIRTIEVTTAGVCVDSAVSVVTFDAVHQYWPVTHQIGDTDYFAIAAIAVGREGRIHTFSINTANGALTDIDDDFFWLDDVDPSIIEFAQKGDTDYWMVCFGTEPPEVVRIRISTVEINSSDGTITSSSFIDTLMVHHANINEGHGVASINVDEFIVVARDQVYGMYIDADGMIVTGDTLDYTTDNNAAQTAGVIGPNISGILTGDAGVGELISISMEPNGDIMVSKINGVRVYR